MEPQDVRDRLQKALQEVEQLKEGMSHRDRIGVAKGMLMMRYNLTEEMAFAFLARRSQDENVKLYDLAATVIAHLVNEVNDVP